MKIYFSHKEELWNSWSHAAGIILGMLVGTALLVWCGWARNGWATAGVILYLFGMLSSYIASTVYHALSAWSPWKERLRKLDAFRLHLDCRHCRHHEEFLVVKGP